ncbi:mevalonate kinase family protein [Neolewinella antarctica]|uniref:mevalonate kinase n=1 Tax=Neolewinella antarctica TaxID=442734 RepID=A0ABX0XDW2_9BACT|nr:hypothetical protein [Neolewinella antarctica]NJC27465.1 mevalonate kinase [Neolewinella antarctica]
MGNRYPAKVLLFGEHTVLRGGRGLAVPYGRLSLRWEESKPDETLLRFGDYLKKEFSQELLDTNSLEDHLLEDWRLTGNIPVGYGLGSSGAVCAAIFDRFATDKGRQLSGNELRHQLARMENYFHGDSSGTDPLICYLQQPMLLGQGVAPQAVQLPEDYGDYFFLVDTGRTRKASTLIRKFTEAYDGRPEFAAMVDNVWKPKADTAIDALLNNDRKALLKAFAEISEFQIKHLRTFIPKPIRKQWSGSNYRLKICGAGGGGMLLGMANRPNARISGLGTVYWLREGVVAGQ